jgi:hypothetical protein
MALPNDLFQGRFLSDVERDSEPARDMTPPGQDDQQNVRISRFELKEPACHRLIPNILGREKMP